MPLPSSKYYLGPRAGGNIVPVEPISGSATLPFWSVMIPTFNCSDYLRLTLASVLEQDPGPDRMHIEVVDDCSTKDDPKFVVEELGRGRVAFHRHDRNRGVGGNLAACAARSRGRFVHVLHGDDLVKPGFYARYEAMIAKYSDATLYISPAEVIDERGVVTRVSSIMGGQSGPVEDFDLIQAVRNEILTPSVVIPRATLEAVGGYDVTLGHTADWEMFYRAGLHSHAVTDDQPTVQYRMASTNDTSRLVKSGENIAEVIKAIDACIARLPPERRSKLQANRYQWAADLAQATGMNLSKMGLFDAASRQQRWAWRLGHSDIKSTMKLLVWTARSLIGRSHRK